MSSNKTFLRFFAAHSWFVLFEHDSHFFGGICVRNFDERGQLGGVGLTVNPKGFKNPVRRLVPRRIYGRKCLVVPQSLDVWLSLSDSNIDGMRNHGSDDLVEYRGLRCRWNRHSLSHRSFVLQEDLGMP